MSEVPGDQLGFLTVVRKSWTERGSQTIWGHVVGRGRKGGWGPEAGSGGLLSLSGLRMDLRCFSLCLCMCV